MTNNRAQRFKAFCAAGNKIVADTGVGPSEVTCYAISMAAFGKKPNGDCYVMFDEWLKQQQAIPGAPPVGMPAEAAAALENWAEHFKAQLMQRVVGIVHDVAGTFEQTTTLRVTALERVCSDQVRRNQEIVANQRRLSDGSS